MSFAWGKRSSGDVELTRKGSTGTDGASAGPSVGRAPVQTSAREMVVQAIIAYALCICAVLVASLLKVGEWRFTVAVFAACVSFGCGLYWSLKLAILCLADGIRRRR